MPLGTRCESEEISGAAGNRLREIQVVRQRSREIQVVRQSSRGIPEAWRRSRGIPVAWQRSRGIPVAWQRSREIQAVHCALCRSYDQGQGWNRTGCRKEQYDAIRRVKASYSDFWLFCKGKTKREAVKASGGV